MEAMMKKPNRWLFRIVAVLIATAVLYGLWQLLQPNGLPDGLASGNGRIEAIEIDIATKSAGRVEEILSRFQWGSPRMLSMIP